MSIGATDPASLEAFVSTGEDGTPLVFSSDDFSEFTSPIVGALNSILVTTGVLQMHCRPDRDMLQFVAVP